MTKKQAKNPKHHHHHHHHQDQQHGHPAQDNQGVSTMPGKRRKKERLGRNARIVIVGSGLGGLSAALALEQNGYTNVTVVERDESVSARKEGYGLTLTYNPKGPLAQLQVLPEVAENDCPSRSHYMFAPDGRVLGYYGNAFTPLRGMGQRGNLRVPRQLLRRTLLNRLQTSVCFGKRLVGLEATVESCDEDQTRSDSPKLSLRFEDGSTEHDIDLLVAADGIRSTVLRTLLPNDSSLRYLGVFIVLGIADYWHPLLDERGFYTLDGEHRLFTMPYEGSALEPDKGRRFMWQLSFRLDDHEKATELGKLDSESLRKLVLSRCDGWHEPVTDMMRSTPTETIWATPLMDRDPTTVVQSLRTVPKASRVVVLGDAAHAMSPFKGQGANQALADGPLLACWIGKASLPAAVKGFHREMTQRSGIKVRQSRQAAGFLHSSCVLLPDHASFAGVDQKQVSVTRRVLEEHKVGAWCGAKLDDKVRSVLKEEKLLLESSIQSDGHNHSNDGIHGQDHDNHDQNNKCIDDKRQESFWQDAQRLASTGDTMSLRTLSLDSTYQIRSVRDDRGRSCLHLAALNGHWSTCKWLLSEAFLDCHGDCDQNGDSPIDLARKSGHRKIVQLFCSGGRVPQKSIDESHHSSTTTTSTIDDDRDGTERSSKVSVCLTD